MALEHDAKGESMGASVMRWDGERVRLERRTGEAAETFQFRAGALAGDLASAQAYVMGELKRVPGEA